MKPINLGKKYDNSCCAPCSPKSSKEEVHFPSIYLSAAKLEGIPRAGTITFRYELGSKNENYKQDTTDLCIELLQVMDYSEDAKAKKLVSTEDALDKLKNELVGEDEDDDESEDGDRSEYAE